MYTSNITHHRLRPENRIGSGLIAFSMGHPLKLREGEESRRAENPRGHRQSGETNQYTWIAERG